jgi:hypothetical protein
LRKRANFSSILLASRSENSKPKYCHAKRPVEYLKVEEIIGLINSLIPCKLVTKFHLTRFEGYNERKSFVLLDLFGSIKKSIS